MSIDVQANPVLSVYELVLLYDDKPTTPLIRAICQSVDWRPTPSKRRLLTAMYGVPESGTLPDWFAYRLTDEQERTLDLGYDLWLRDR